MATGQRYRDLPFDERFGGFERAPARDPELIRRRFQEELLKRKFEEGGPGLVPPGYQERLADPTKVISSNIPPQQVPVQGDVGVGAGALPMPEYIRVMEELLKSQQRNQGIEPRRNELPFYFG